MNKCSAIVAVDRAFPAAVAELERWAASHLKMKISDYLGFGLALAFGLWFLVFPQSVIRVYNWFHRGKVRMPGTFGVRLSGVLWIILLCVVMVAVLSTK